MSSKLKNLKSKKILADLLGVSPQQLRKIAFETKAFYNVFTLGTTKPRQVEEPIKALRRIHDRLKILLQVLPLPEYMHSGRKGRSYISNGRIHVGSKSFATMDITAFYKSCSRARVKRFFISDLCMSSDVAEVLSKLVTFEDFLPTGSPISQLLAFWSNSDLFDEANAIAQKCGYTFGQYVDDLGFSSSATEVHTTIHLEINRVLQRGGLKLKRKKIRYARHGRGIEMTGTFVTANGEMKAPHKLLKKLFTSLNQVGRDVKRLDEKSISSSIGVLRSIRSVEKGRFPQLYDKMRKHERDLRDKTL